MWGCYSYTWIRDNGPVSTGGERGGDVGWGNGVVGGTRESGRCVRVIEVEEAGEESVKCDVGEVRWVRRKGEECL